MHLSKGGKGSKKRSAKAAQESSQAPDTDSELDAEAEDEATEESETEESETEESVPLDLGDPDIDGEDTEGIEDVEKEALASRGDQDAAARTVAIRRALEERNERRRMAEDLDYLDFDD